MIEKIRPLYDRVLIKRLEDIEETTLGGIIIPDAAKEKGQLAEVLAVGTGRLDSTGKLQPLQVKGGDRVMISKYAGTETGSDKNVLIVREDDILGIVEK